MAGKTFADVESPELKAALLLASRANRETLAGIRAATRQSTHLLQSEMVATARGQASRHSKPMVRVAESVRVTATGRGVTATIGTVGAIRPGVKMKTITRAYEFGTRTPNKRFKVTPGGGRRPYWRRTHRQLPAYKASGRMFYPAVAVVAPEIVSVWVRAITKHWREGGW